VVQDDVRRLAEAIAETDDPAERQDLAETVARILGKLNGSFDPQAFFEYIDALVKQRAQ
jgi:non-homologous end joining protein Ku